MHAHSDYLLLADPYADNKVLQGITTDIGGNCGLSPGPFAGLWFVDWWIDSTRNFHAVPWDEGVRLVRQHGIELDWTTIGGFLDRLERAGIALNFALLVGHYILRATAYSEPNVQPTRRATRREVETMRAMVTEAMDQGALGLSVGFQHTDPELDMDVDEMVALCEIVAERSGIFIIHLRSYGAGLVEAGKQSRGVVSNDRPGVACLRTVPFYGGDSPDWAEISLSSNYLRFGKELP